MCIEKVQKATSQNATGGRWLSGSSVRSVVPVSSNHRKAGLALWLSVISTCRRQRQGLWVKLSSLN